MCILCNIDLRTNVFYLFRRCAEQHKLATTPCSLQLKKTKKNEQKNSHENPPRAPKKTRPGVMVCVPVRAPDARVTSRSF